MSQKLEEMFNEIQYSGINTAKNIVSSGTITNSGAVSSSATISLTGSATLDMSASSGKPINEPTVTPNGLYTTAVTTTGATAVNLFGTTVGFALTLTSIQVGSVDNSNGVIDVYSDGVCLLSIQKGSGGTTKVCGLNCALNSLCSLKAVSSNGIGSGNAVVIATFTVT